MIKNNLKTGLTIILIMISFIIVNAQNKNQKKIDSLNSVLKTLKEGQIDAGSWLLFDEAYYNFSDSLKWCEDTITIHWQKPSSGKRIYKEYKTNIWYMFPVKISSSILNKPISISYSFKTAFQIYINGKLVESKGNIAYSKDYEINANGNFYTVFNKPNNYITVRTFGHQLSRAYFVIRNDKMQSKENEYNEIFNSISMALGIFYFTFFFIYFILFLSDKTAKANLYFSLFCFFLFFIFIETANINRIENYKLYFFCKTLTWAFLAPVFYTFICFFHHLVYGKLKKYLRFALILTCASSITFIISKFIANTNLLIIALLGFAPIFLLSIIDGIRVVNIGRKRKIAGIKPIIYGVFITIFLFIVLFTLIPFYPEITDIRFFLISSLLLTVIPISVSITLIKKYTATSKQLALELVNVSILSEKSILQEKEKQQILETQNEKLEEQVLERTSEIVKQKNEIELQKHKVEEAYEELNQQNYEISAQRDEIEKQKYRIEYIYEELTDSIRYAERIQNAILPHKQYIKDKIKGEFFILFKPRDIVSGDFYWFTKRDNWLLIAVADCTGHGVPGAFMSMLGISFLNEIVSKEEVRSSSQVLDELRKYVIHSLQQKGVQGEQQDGMDIAFLALNTETNILEFSGANNPLYIIPAVSNEILIIKADTMPIGIYGDMQPFKNNTLQVNKGDRLYIFSDGFIDQFGGENRKKFLNKRFKESLLQIAHLPMLEQKENLNNIFESWKGKCEQIDDVTVLGIKI